MLVLLTTVLPDELRMVPSSVAAVSSAGAIGHAMLRRRVVRWQPWALITGGILALLLAGAVWSVWWLVAGDPPRSPSVVDAFFLAGYPLFALALIRLACPLGGVPKRAGLLDAAIATCGVTAVFWTFLVDPLIGAEATSKGLLVTAVAYPALDLLLLLLTVRLLLVTRVPTVSLRLVVVGFSAIIAADIGLELELLRGAPQPNAASYLAWGLAWAAFGAAALHPSVGQPVAESTGWQDGTLSRGRLTALSVLAFAGPTVSLSRLRPESVSAPDLVVQAVLAGTLSALLVVRLGKLAGLAQRRSAELDTRAAELGQSLREQAELQDQLSHRATHDPMTGLPNRALLLDRLERALGQHAGTGSHALLLLDLDGFKDVNDTYGHPVGDELLAAVSGRLLGEIPGGDTLARLGGDEFAVLLMDVTSAQALAVANRLVAKTRSPYAVDGRECYLTASIGLVTIGREVRTPTGLMRDADLALYAAKGAGKNQVVAFQPGLRTAHNNRTRLALQLRRALVREEFTLYYQPVVTLRTGQVAAVEALLRWTLPDGRQVPPSEFIPVAEEIGLIVPIGDWALRQACMDTRRWHAEHGIAVAVNISGRQLVEPDFADKVIAALRTAELPGEAIMIEITETVLVATSTEADPVNSRLGRLREQGVRIAIDDFGTGYSSLSYLRQLPVDVLKIDRIFTNFPGGEAAGEQHRAFTQAILQLSGSLGLQTIAEGVETADQATALRQMDCPMAQGYHFARPMLAADINRLLDPAANPAAKQLSA